MPNSPEGREAAVCAHGKMAPPCGCFVFAQPAPTAPPPAAPSEAREEGDVTAELGDWLKEHADRRSVTLSARQMVMLMRVHARLATVEAELQDVRMSDCREVLCRVFDDFDEAWEEWLAWWNPTQWFHEYRALGAFIRTRIDARRPPTPGDTP